jgi:hypothetical protein
MYSGKSLTTTGPEKMAQVGPFFDETKLRVWLQEMAMRLSHAYRGLLGWAFLLSTAKNLRCIFSLDGTLLVTDTQQHSQSVWRFLL